VIGVPLVLKFIDKPRSSAADRLAVQGNSAAVLHQSNCSGKLELTSIWLATGCENSREQARRP
jgi:hypothetical protein